MKVLNWAKFFAVVLPYLSDLARALFERFDGNPTPAVAELRRYITDHGKRRKDAEAAMDAELAEDAAKKRSTP